MVLFSQLVKTTKPTGRGDIPIQVQRAHEIEDLINETAGTRDLNDSEFDDVADSESRSHISVSSDTDEEPQATPSQPPPPKVAIAKSARGQASSSRRGGPSVDLINNLSQAFDPEAQRQRDADRANRSLQNTQILAMTQQLRDAQQQTDVIRAQLNDIQQRLHESERARDRAELRLEVIQLSTSHQPQGQSRQRTRRPEPRQSKKMHKSETWYPEGGGKTEWFTDVEDMESNDSRVWCHEGYYVRGHRDRRSRSPRPSTSARRSYYQSPSPATPRRRLTSRREDTPFPDIGTMHSHSNNISSIHAPAASDIATRSAPPMAPIQDPSTLMVSGNAVELTVSPRRGDAVSFLISPSRTSAAARARNDDDSGEEEQPICSQWSQTQRSPQ